MLVDIDEGCLMPGIFNDMYKGLLELLRGHEDLHLEVIKSIGELTRIERKPDILLFVNEFITKNPIVVDTILKPFLDGGGLAIFGGNFASFSRTDDMDKFFAKFGLPWKHAAYNRATFGISRIGKSILENVSGTLVPDTICVKAVQLSNVGGNELLYSPLEGGVTQGLLFHGDPTNPNLAMAAFSKVGRGVIAYIGDVNGEQESNSLTLGLCLAKFE